MTTNGRAAHQFLATAEPGAVGAHALHLRDLLRDLGFQSELFAEHRRGPFETHARPLGDYAPRPGDVAIYQMAIGSIVADFVMERCARARIVVNHHNLTPTRYLLPWEPAAAAGIQWGVRQLEQFGGCAELGVADSHFNEGDLIEIGYRQTAVAPVLFDPRRLAAEPEDAELAGQLCDGRGTSWLFVGRVAANKCQHQLIRALAVYRRLYDPDARLYIVGGPPTGPYPDALRRYAGALGLSRAVSFSGSVTPAQLATYYRHADVFVCLSEHEGFCVPVVEAMSFGQPVVAAATSALPETVASAGLLLPPGKVRDHAERASGAGQPDAAVVAAAVHRVLHDPGLRASMVAAGRARAEDFSLPCTSERMKSALEPVLVPG